MRFLITGGSGFIGAHVARRCLLDGDDVIVCDLEPTTRNLIQTVGADAMERVTAVAADVADLDGMLDLCMTHRIDRIIHLAYVLGSESTEAPYLASRVNALGFANLLEVARRLELGRVAWASSLGVFGLPYDRMIDDATEPNPQSLYGACKALNERQGAVYLERFGTESVGLRLPVTYGPGRTRGRGNFVNELLQQPALGRPGAVDAFGPGPLPWIHVEDAAAALLQAAKAPQPPRTVYNLFTDLAPIEDAIRVVRRLVPDAELSLQGEYRPLLPGSLRTDVQRDLGWVPRFDLESGFAAAIAAFASLQESAPAGATSE